MTPEIATKLFWRTIEHEWPDWGNSVLATELSWQDLDQNLLTLLKTERDWQISAEEDLKWGETQ